MKTTVFGIQSMFTGPRPHLLEYQDDINMLRLVFIVVLVIKESLLQQQLSSGTCSLKLVTIDWINSLCPYLMYFWIVFLI